MKIFTKVVPIFLSIILFCISSFLGFEILQDKKETALDYTDINEVISVIDTSEISRESTTITVSKETTETTEIVTSSYVYSSAEITLESGFFVEEESYEETEATESKSEFISSETTEDSSENNSGVVYITATGSKFHNIGCQYLSKSSYEIDRSQALNEGYTPCSRCKP